MVDQTGQVFNILHRSGNIHDSNGAQDFIANCIEHLRLARPGVVVEVRTDSAFFSDALINVLEDNAVEKTIRVSFERLLVLKQ